jgi:hypothetical protein
MGMLRNQFAVRRLAILPMAIVIAWANVQLVTAGDKPMLADPTQFEVEITETEKGFDFKGWAFTEHPVKIIIRNKNHVTHGFTSTLFNEIPIRMEGQGSEVRGKHFKSFHLEPGKTMTLHFTPPMKKHPTTGQPEHQYYMVWCDIHPEAKGELHIVETLGEIGGG